MAKTTLRMGIIGVLVLVLACCGCTSWGTPSSPSSPADTLPAEPSDYIHAEGRLLMIDNEPILLRGVNAGGWLLTEDWFTPTSCYERLDTENGQYEWERALVAQHGEEKTRALLDTYHSAWWQEQDFASIAAIGFNTIRLPFGWKDLALEDGTLREDAFALLDWFVDQCARHGLYVVLDMHGAFGSQNGRHHSGDTTQSDLFGNEANEQRTVALWSAIAAHYATNKWVAGYDLLNEPEGTPGGTTQAVQWRFYDRLYQAIRQVDSHHLIIMESCWDVYNMPNPHNYGWENVAYEYHYYNWNNGNDLDATMDYLESKAMYEALLNETTYQVPVYIGEFTFFDNEYCWEYGLQFFAEHHMNWTMWTYKACGNGNWALFNAPARTLDTIITPSTPYEKAMRIAESMSTASSFHENTALVSLLRRILSATPQ